MATAKFNLAASDDWTQVAADTNDYVFVENQSLVPVLMAYMATATLPTDDATAHILKPGQAVPRVGTGFVYVKSKTETPKSKVIVST